MTGRFDEVELQKPKEEQMKRFRVQMAEQLESILEAWELPKETTVTELIERLRKS